MSNRTGNPGRDIHLFGRQEAPRRWRCAHCGSTELTVVCHGGVSIELVVVRDRVVGGILNGEQLIAGCEWATCLVCKREGRPVVGPTVRPARPLASAARFSLRPNQRMS